MLFGLPKKERKIILSIKITNKIKYKSFQDSNLNIKTETTHKIIDSNRTYDKKSLALRFYPIFVVQLAIL